MVQKARLGTRKIDMHGDYPLTVAYGYGGGLLTPAPATATVPRPRSHATEMFQMPF